MKHIAVVTLTVATLAVTFASTAGAADAPADRVVAIYFHRTQRCPTCLKMGSYSEEVVKKGFVKQVKEGSVEFRYVDFQNKKNAALTKGYQVSGPALIIAKIEQNKVKQYKNLKDIWTEVRDKPKFLKYVGANVEAYLKPSRSRP